MSTENYADALRRGVIQETPHNLLIHTIEGDFRVSFIDYGKVAFKVVYVEDSYVKKPLITTYVSPRFNFNLSSTITVQLSIDKMLNGNLVITYKQLKGL